MKFSFKEFMETVDNQQTATYFKQGPEQQPQQQDFHFPDLETYKKYKVQSDPRTSSWTDMQWAIQYHFDRTHAQQRTRSTKPIDSQATPVTKF